MGELFVSGADLSRRFYHDEVRPLLDERHSAALLGPGSEVLGFDTARSTDHDWGPRVQLFFTAGHRHDYDVLLTERLSADVRSAVVVTEPAKWFTGQLGFSPGGPVGTFDWLATSTQSFAEVTAGAVFHDGLDVLAPIRHRLDWYPDDVWRYVLACQWQRVSQEEAFVGRTREVGDELGSAVVAARLVRDLMRLCLLMARRYPPYGKWLGSAFARLPAAVELAPVLRNVLVASSWRDREQRLADAYEIVAGLHNELGLTEFVDPATRPYHGRPFQVLHAERFAAALLPTISDETIRSLPPTGAVDQFLDSTDVLQHVTRRRAVAKALFER
jgi:hypothetical protein